MELDRSNIRKIRGLIVFTVLILIGVYRFEVVLDIASFLLGIVLPFILGCAIAFILSVPMGWLKRKLFEKPIARAQGQRAQRLKRLANPISLLLALLLVLLVLFIVTAVVLPELGATVSDLAKTLPKQIPAMMDSLERTVGKYADILFWFEGIEVDWEQMISSIISFLQSGAGNFLDSTIGMAKNIVSALTTFVIGFVFACYILLQKETLGRQCRKLIYAYLPQKRADRLLEIAALTHRIFTSFLAGQCLEAVILGVMFFIAMSALRFPYALLVGVLIAFTALIPIFGAFIGCFVGTFLILTVSPGQALAFVVLFLVLQQVEGNLIYPRVVGGSVGLPSIWVLAAVSIGGSLFGIVGMLVFIPIVSVLYSLLRADVNKRLGDRTIV